MTTGEVDIGAEALDMGASALEECAREAIHVPGAVQPHGALLAVREDDLRVVQASENTRALVGVDARALLGQPLRAFLDPGSWDLFERALRQSSLRKESPLFLRFAGLAFTVMLHRSEGLVVLELETAGPPEESRTSGTLQFVLARLSGARTVLDLLRSMATEIKTLTGYDRVMIYRFHDDLHGEVIAEAREPELEPYLGLHYPASDIPAQARRLYAKNLVRCIRDVEAASSPLVPPENPRTGRPLDLSDAWLRSVSPVHVQYLRNMGVTASMSISLLRGGELFGLVACHHRAPRLLVPAQRGMCEVLGRVVSFQIEVLDQKEAAEQKLRASTLAHHYVEQVTARLGTSSRVAPGKGEAEKGMLGQVGALLGFVEATGVAVVDESQVATAGVTPAAEDVRRIATWLREVMKEPIFATDSLGAQLPLARGLAAVASGLLVTSFSSEGRTMSLWFRPEIERTVSWGGDPRKVASRDPRTMRIEPRRSFEVWRQTVRGCADPWKPWEIEAASALRAAVVGIVLGQAADLARLAADLRAALRARDDFLSVASHELRTPIATLRLTLEALQRATTRSGEGGLSRTDAMPRIEMAMRQVERCVALVDQLLDVSQLSSGKLSLSFAETDLGELVRRVAERLAIQAAAAGSMIEVRAEVGVVGQWDEGRLDQVVTNLLTNAIKYGAGRPVTVEVAARQGQAELVVKDRGIGIPADAQARIFERFERAVPASHYGGFGLGLWIVRQFVEQMGGHVRVASIEGQGATFTVCLPLVRSAAPAVEGQDVGGS
ncbi:GAF domain-containing protein [Polyangium jinanense]|uniref:ATP-binding protein n=1 Tax=Polyangium jinanense TaxID=2829994 RepID=UPI00233FED29|nr:ATP-binding protein [Polyangium jinanense]MDC3960299.1 GAF domain-containing protein [Polyangium jinanense]